MKLYCISAERNKTTTQLLKKSAEAMNLDFIQLDSDHFDPLFNYEQFTGQDELVYRCSISHRARIMEQLIIRPQTATFYINYARSQSYIDNVVRASIIHQNENISIPKTFFLINKNRNDLRKMVEALNGFPIIIKTVGGSHGIGVMKVDSLASLFSIIDFFIDQGIAIILREFIHAPQPTHARLVVLNNEVIDSIEYTAPADDFRSNEGSLPNVKPKLFDDNMKNLAVRAVKVLGLEFG